MRCCQDNDSRPSLCERTCYCRRSDEARLPLCGNGPLIVSLFILQMVCERIWSCDGMILRGETENVGENLVPVPLFPSQIPHGLT
jgi:hypothetical protein